jgi:hypothetical protein
VGSETANAQSESQPEPQFVQDREDARDRPLDQAASETANARSESQPEPQSVQDREDARNRSLDQAASETANAQSQPEPQFVQDREDARNRPLDQAASETANAQSQSQPQSVQMGLLKHLLFWPVTGPKFLTEFSLGKVRDVVREELTDDARVKSELMELQLQLELGDIDEDEYVRRELELMAQLREIRDWREHFGMGVAGGPVRVQSAGGGAPTESAGAEQEVAAEAPSDRVPQVARPDDAAIELNLDDAG